MPPSLLSGDVWKDIYNKLSHSGHLLSSKVLGIFDKFLLFNTHVSLFYQPPVTLMLQITETVEKLKIFENYFELCN